MQAPAGHLQNLTSLQDALAILGAQAAAAAQAARVEEHKRAREAEYAALMGLTPPEDAGSEAAAPKKAKPSEQAAAADEAMDFEEPEATLLGAPGSASPGRGAG